MLKEKYQSLLDYGSSLNIKDVQVTESAGTLSIKGLAPYQFDKDRFWDKAKTFANWEKEVAINIAVEKTDSYGFYTIQSGDTLSKLAKAHLGDARRYMEIFKLNTDKLKDPDKIMAGQTIKLPPK
jgi:nucleoid-associated protein YgaU